MSDGEELYALKTVKKNRKFNATLTGEIFASFLINEKEIGFKISIKSRFLVSLLAAFQTKVTIISLIRCL